MHPQPVPCGASFTRRDHAPRDGRRLGRVRSGKAIPSFVADQLSEQMEADRQAYKRQVSLSGDATQTTQSPGVPPMLVPDLAYAARHGPSRG